MDPQTMAQFSKRWGKFGKDEMKKYVYHMLDFFEVNSGQKPAHAEDVEAMDGLASTLNNVGLIAMSWAFSSRDECTAQFFRDLSMAVIKYHSAKKDKIINSTPYTQ